MATSNESQQKGETDPRADFQQDDQDRTSGEEAGFVFDEKKKHYPFFALTEVPAGVGLSLRSIVPAL